MSETPETVQRICSKCNNTVDVDAKFCKYCGFNFAGSAANLETTAVIENNSPSTQSEPRKNDTSLYVFGGVAVLIVLVVLAFVALKSQNRNSQASTPETNNIATVSPMPFTLSEKAKQVEEKILRGESLSSSDIEGIPTQELRILRNVHFARYGRKYDKPGLGDYFYSCSWYKPNDDYKDSMVNSTDKANVNLILEMEQQGSIATPNTPANRSESTSATPVYSPTPTYETPAYDASDGKLTNQKVERAITQVLTDVNCANVHVDVIGIQEEGNAARADIRMSFIFPNKRFQFNGNAFAVLTHYNDGRWILTKVYQGQNWYNDYWNCNVTIR